MMPGGELTIWKNPPAYSAAMDFVLALIPWKILLELNMKRAERMGAAIAMSMGVMWVGHFSSLVINYGSE